MPEIQAFRGIRYNLGQVGSLSDVVAPPYDTIGSELQEELYKKHPCNIVRLELNRPEPGDDEANNSYIRAAKFFKSWLNQGVLVQEAVPSLYVYHQHFNLEGRDHIRRGFMARMRLQRFGEGMVFPHEQTLRAPKIDRLMLTAVCKANFSQIFALYPDPAGEVQPILEETISDKIPLEATDHLGVIHRLWPVTDVGVIGRVCALMGPKPVFIADGHHRYETACDYRDQVYDSGALRPDHPANYVLTMLVALEDPGLVIMPTHRLFRGLGALNALRLQENLEPYFSVRHVLTGLEEGIREVWEDISTASVPVALGFFTRIDETWTIAELTEQGQAKMDEVAADHHEPWRRLAVSVLHRLVIEHLLGGNNLPSPTFVHRLEEVVEGCRKGEYELVALVPPVGIAQVRDVSLTGERLPPKTTYFYPKLLAGLVINPLE